MKEPIGRAEFEKMHIFDKSYPKFPVITNNDIICCRDCKFIVDCPNNMSLSFDDGSIYLDNLEQYCSWAERAGGFEGWTTDDLFDFVKTLGICKFHIDGDNVCAELPEYAKVELRILRWSDGSPENVLLCTQDFRDDDGEFAHGFSTAQGLVFHLKWFIDQMVYRQGDEQ